jgi:putative tryptophan/tyrosine transport system substrate-binding protein
MKRREFITLLGGAAAWPLAARAQQPAVPVIGMLRSTRAEGFAYLTEALRAGLSESGYDAGRNVVIECRWADEQRDRLPALAAELIRKPVAVIVANSIAALAAKAATSTVPIVFVTGSDPIGDGLVTSFSRPSGNVTGISFLSAGSSGKRLELLRQLVPGAATIAALVDPRTAETLAERRDLEAAAQAVRQRLFVVEIREDRELEPAFASMVEQKAGALYIGVGAYFSARQRLLAALALRHRLPAAHAQREFVLVGGLMSYGTSISDAYRQAGLYAGRILKGEQPTDLPVLQATKFEFLLNLATAKAIGLAVPMHIHAVANEVTALLRYICLPCWPRRNQGAADIGGLTRCRGFPRDATSTRLGRWP